MIRLPRHTARLRLAALYAGLFLVSGVALVAGTYVLFEHVTKASTPRLPQIPHAPTVRPLQQLQPQFPQAFYLLQNAQHQLARDQNQLKSLPLATGRTVTGGLRAFAPQLVRDEHQLNKHQHRLAAAVRQLARAERQVSRAGSAQAAQRASDSSAPLEGDPGSSNASSATSSTTPSRATSTEAASTYPPAAKMASQC